MKVLILAAGRSTRLNPIEDKNLIKFNGAPLIEWRLRNLAKAGFNDFIIMVGPHNRLQIERTFLETPYQITIEDQEDLDEGMAGAIKSAEKHLKGESVLIVSTNDSVDQNLLDTIYEEIKKDPEALIVGKKVKQYFPGGYIEINPNGTLKNIIEKPGEGNEPSDMINLVYHYYKDAESLIAELKKTKSRKDDIYELALKSLVQNGLQMDVIEYSGNWHPIKYPHDIIKTARFYHAIERSKGIHPKANIHRSATITGEVIIEEGVTVHPNAVIQGPAYIGKDSIIAVNAFIRDSYIGQKCVIGSNSEVARSVIGDKSWTHQNYIGDSIIGDNVSFGAGTITGNLRLDEKEIENGQNKLGLITGNNIRVGINTSFMPGVKIGGNSMIGAGLTINEDVPESSFVKTKTKAEIRPNKKEITPRD